MTGTGAGLPLPADLVDAAWLAMLAGPEWGKADFAWMARLDAEHWATIKRHVLLGAPRGSVPYGDSWVEDMRALIGEQQAHLEVLKEALEEIVATVTSWTWVPESRDVQEIATAALARVAT